VIHVLRRDRIKAFGEQQTFHYVAAPQVSFALQAMVQNFVAMELLAI
jgi:hypothetical protein